MAWLGSVLLVVVEALAVVVDPDFLLVVASGIQKDLTPKIWIDCPLLTERNLTDPFSDGFLSFLVKDAFYCCTPRPRQTGWHWDLLCLQSRGAANCILGEMP